MNHILFGPLPIDRPGGITSLFKDYCIYLNNKGFDIEVVNTNFTSTSIFKGLITIIKCLIKNRNSNSYIGIHATYKDVKYILPLIIFLKGSKQPLYIRKFAGDFWERFNLESFIFKKLILYTLRKTDLLFFECKYLIKEGNCYNIKSLWWPNSRSKPTSKIFNTKSFTPKFIFIGTINQDKGVSMLIELARRNSSMQIDIVGPIQESLFKTVFEKNEIKNVKYLGIVEYDLIQELLTNYSALLLPTKYKSEGYPGVLIEALSTNTPVISTRIGGIPEIISNQINGFLMESWTIEELEKCINLLEQNYDVIQSRIPLSFDSFNSSVVYENCLEIIQGITYQ